MRKSAVRRSRRSRAGAGTQAFGRVATAEAGDDCAAGGGRISHIRILPRELNLAMCVAVPIVHVMKGVADEKIEMIAMSHALVAAIGAMNMAKGVSADW